MPERAGLVLTEHGYFGPDVRCPVSTLTGVLLFLAMVTAGCGSSSTPPTSGLPNTPQPTVVITSPANNGSVPVGTVWITGTAATSISGRGVKAVEITLDDDPSAFQLATPHALGDWSAWSIAYPVAMGAHTLTARVTDATGNQQSVSIRLSVVRGVVMNFVKYKSTTVQNLDAISALQSSDVTDVSLFAYHVNAAGTGLDPDGNLINDTAVIAKTHAAGRKATVTIGGGTQNTADITSAVVTNRTTTVNTIANKVLTGGYDGVKLDIENTTGIGPADMVQFVKELRTALDQLAPGLTLSADVQPRAYQGVWSQLPQAEPYLTYILVMVYDFTSGYTTQTIKDFVTTWTPYMNNRKEKVYPGLALLDGTGRVLTVAEVDEMGAWVNQNGYGGLMIWNNYFMTSDYWNVLHHQFAL